MIRLLLLTAVLALSMARAAAQSPQAEPSPAVLQSCLLGTPEATWSTLKLSSDQLYRIRLVQEACKEECDAAGVKHVPNPISNADGNTILTEVRNILTADQYQAWVAYCTRSGGAGGAPK